MTDASADQTRARHPEYRRRLPEAWMCSSADGSRVATPPVPLRSDRLYYSTIVTKLKLLPAHSGLSATGNDQLRGEPSATGSFGKRRKRRCHVGQEKFGSATDAFSWTRTAQPKKETKRFRPRSQRARLAESNAGANGAARRAAILQDEDSILLRSVYLQTARINRELTADGIFFTRSTDRSRRRRRGWRECPSD